MDFEKNCVYPSFPILLFFLQFLIVGTYPAAKATPPALLKNSFFKWTYSQP